MLRNCCTENDEIVGEDYSDSIEKMHFQTMVCVYYWLKKVMNGGKFFLQPVGGIRCHRLIKFLLKNCFIFNTGQQNIAFAIKNIVCKSVSINRKQSFPTYMCTNRPFGSACLTKNIVQKERRKHSKKERQWWKTRLPAQAETIYKYIQCVYEEEEEEDIDREDVSWGQFGSMITMKMAELWVDQKTRKR